MSDPTKVAALRQQQVTVAGWDGFFATKTGGEVTANTTQAYDGGAIDPEVLGGPPSTSNITVTRPYRPGPHGALLKAWEKEVGRLRTTVAVYDTDPDLGPWGEPVTYADALLTRAKRVDYDAASAEPGSIELEFSVRRGA